MADRAEISKRIERAEKFLQKGKPEAALEAATAGIRGHALRTIRRLS